MSFEYHEPETLEETLALLRQHRGDAQVLAGGTAFALMVKIGLTPAGHVIGLRRVEAVNGIEETDSGLWIGANTTHRALELAPELGSYAPLHEVFSGISTVRIRTQATVGGNLCQAGPAHDPPPSLIALGAIAHIVSDDGVRRQLPVEDFLVNYYVTALEETEILTGITVPRPGPTTASTYKKFLPITADDYAVISVAASITTHDHSRVSAASIIVGCGGPTPIRATEVESILVGHELTQELITEASAEIRAQGDRFDSLRTPKPYKIDMAAVFIKRALTELASQTGHIGSAA